VIEMGKLEDDVEVLSGKGSFVIGSRGRIMVGPTQNIYSEDELIKLGLERKGTCVFYSKEKNMTFYLFQGTIGGKDAYKIIEVKKGCFK